MATSTVSKSRWINLVGLMVLSTLVALVLRLAHVGQKCLTPVKRLRERRKQR